VTSLFIYLFIKLNLASMKGHLDCISKLIDAGASVNLKDVEGNAALAFSAEKGYLLCVSVLINRGLADVNAKNHLGFCALHMATDNRRLAVVSLLLERSANVNAKSIEGYSAMDIAKLKSGSEEIIQILKQHGAIDDVVIDDCAD
jgi:ankyrin repeat protein